MAFLTGLARSISGIADERAADLKSERKRQQLLDEQRAVEDRKFAQQEKLARMKQEILGTAKAASPELQQALQEGRFQDLAAIAAKNPADAKVLKSISSVMSQQAQAFFGETTRKATADRAAKEWDRQQGVRTKDQKELIDYRASKKPAKSAKAKTSAPSKNQKDRLSRQKELIRLLEKQKSLMKTKTTKQVPGMLWGTNEQTVDNPDVAVIDEKIVRAYAEMERMLTGEEGKPKPAPEYILPGDDPRAPQSSKVAPKPAGKKPSEGFTKFMELRKSMLGGGQ